MNNFDITIYDNFTPLTQDLSGWGGDDEIFDKLVTQLKPKNVIELGSWKGQSSISIGKSLVKNNLHDSKLYCIDTWLGAFEFWTYLAHTPERDLKLLHGFPQIYYQFISNVIHNNLQNYIIPVPNTTITGLKILKYRNVKPELIYIDASHETEDVYQDLKFSKEMIDKGIIFGDDIDWASVKKAVDQFCTDHHINYRTEGRFWIIEV